MTAAEGNQPHIKKPMRWLTLLWLAVRLVLGLGLLYFSVAQVDWAQLGASLASARPGWMGLALVSVLFSTLLKIARWGMLFPLCEIHPRPGWLRLSGAYLVGQAANVVLPLRGGDLVRLGWFSWAEDARMLPAALTIVLEKYIDILALLLAIFWLGPFLPPQVLDRSRNWLAPLALGLSVLLVLSVIFASAVWKKAREWLARLQIRALGPWLARMDGWMADMRRLRSIRSLRVWLPVAGITLVIWLVMLSTNLLVLKALDLPANLQAAGLVLVLIFIGLAPAIMPGNFGPFYFFAMLGLAPFGIDEPLRAAFAVLLHAVVTLPPVVLAGGFLVGSRRLNRRPV